MATFHHSEQPVHISVTVFYNVTKLTNHLFIFTIEFSEQKRPTSLIPYCHKTGTRPPNCVTPLQPTMYILSLPQKQFIVPTLTKNQHQFKGQS